MRGVFRRDEQNEHDGQEGGRETPNPVPPVILSPCLMQWEQSQALDSIFRGLVDYEWTFRS